METLLAWECGSHLHGPQKLEVDLHTTRPEHEAVKMARVDQGLRAGSALSYGKGKCSSRCVCWVSTTVRLSSTNGCDMKMMNMT
jgi:hypothetical protein